MAPKTTIELVDECDNFPYFDIHGDQPHPSASYFKFRLDGCHSVLGYMLPAIVAKFPPTEIFQIDHDTQDFIFKPANITSNTQDAAVDRTKQLAVYLQGVREKNTFEILNGWRSELYPVYGFQGQLLFSIERSAAALFGIVTYGVHMTAYTKSLDGIKIWTPRRSLTKQTFPGMMDNTVAGGLSTGERPLDCLLRESLEEASLPEDVVRKSNAVGTMTYFFVRDERAGGETGLCQPECQYVYDLVLPESVVPVPGDNEAVDFQLLSLQEVQQALAMGQFKPNCALLLVDFFIRHGIITAENEPDYLEIVARLHRRLDFPLSRT